MYTEVIAHPKSVETTGCSSKFACLGSGARSTETSWFQPDTSWTPWTGSGATTPAQCSWWPATTWSGARRTSPPRMFTW